MARRRPHPLVAAVRKALVPPLGADATAYLVLLERRLGALVEVAAGGDVGVLADPGSHALARRFLRPLVGTWDDGDENLVRGYLDRWVAAGADPVRAAARGLAEAAAALAAIESRPATLWFFLWELESVLSSFVADKPPGPC